MDLTEGVLLTGFLISHSTPDVQKFYRVVLPFDHSLGLLIASFHDCESCAGRVGGRLCKPADETQVHRVTLPSFPEALKKLHLSAPFWTELGEHLGHCLLLLHY